MPYKNPEKRKENSKNYYLKNRDKILTRVSARYEVKKEDVLAYHKQYYLENRKRILSECKEYRTKNKETYRAAIDNWMSLHKEEYKAWKKEWTKNYAKTNRAKIYARDVARRELKKASIDETTDMENIRAFYLLAETLSTETGIKYCVDHINPIIKGGKHHQNNLQVITMIDNLKKGSKYPFEVENKHFPDELYFHPSEDHQVVVA